VKTLRNFHRAALASNLAQGKLITHDYRGLILRLTQPPLQFRSTRVANLQIEIVSDGCAL
jgi:hypothetical protein